MAQPSGQLALASGHSSEYFWYAQGTGIWDAKNSAMLSKTGSAGMSTNGGANVALGNGSTFYTLPATVTKAGDYTLIVRVKVNTGAGTAGMALGDPVGGLGYCWLREDNNEVKMIMGAGGADFFTGSVNVLATWAFVHSGTDVLTYKDATLVNTSTGQTSTLTVTKLLSGYAGDAFALSGEFEFAHVIPSALDATTIAALNADPYAVLDAGGGDTDATAPGAPDTLDLIAPTGVGTGTSAGSTSGTGTGSLASCSLVSITGSGAGTVAGSGTLTTAILMNNAKVPYASLSGWTLNIFNKSTGALVLQVTGLTTDSSGRLSVTNAALTAGTEYSYEPVHTTYGRRLPLGTAA